MKEKLNVAEVEAYLVSLNMPVTENPFIIHGGHKGIIRRGKYTGYVFEELIRIVAEHKGITVTTDENETI